VLRSANQDAQLSSVAVVRSRASKGAPAVTVQVHEVAYVHVEQPTDKTSVAGWYPDPLPPLQTPLKLAARQNQPLWLTCSASRNARAGDHRFDVRINTSVGELKVPLVVHVFDFAVPEDTHLRSALGLGEGAINQYHNLKERAQQEMIFEKYLENFAQHRISPYSFYEYAPIDIRFTGEGPEKKAQVDFTKFDRAATKWLDQHRFNTFQLPLRGMGGGTFHSRNLGELEGFQEGTPEHARLFSDYLGQIEAHLKAKGWLSKAFTYWFDEPDPKDYEFVVAGMKRLKQAAPGIKRMLTEQPEASLIGNVDIWCALTPEWTPERVRARRDAGEEVWWYICCVPKGQYVTEFIDHPGTELRLWPWQSWQYNISGILIWATIWWTSPTAFPPPALQDPWADPMSYVSGYGKPVGAKEHWGNGDGRFLYPPRRVPAASNPPDLSGPVNSLRWENLRDGMEDYEYLWLLQRETERMTRSHPKDPLLTQARDLLVVPEQVSKDLKTFTTDPRVILQHRANVAAMIEKLQKIRVR
jgi:hypothetical protein